MKSYFARAICVGHLAIAAVGPAFAAGEIYPSRPITIVVPNAAGGPTDLLARSIGQRLSQRLNQVVVVDCRGGAAGAIASEYVARAKPDGYTLLLGTTGPLAVNPGLYDKLRYDAKKDFEPVGLISTSSMVLIVRTSLGINNVKDLVALAKRDPDGLTHASSGIGSSGHLAAELFKMMTGIKMRHVPYKAAVNVKVDMFEGRIDVGFAPEGNALKEFVQPGKARALMVSGKARSALFPDVPTPDEVGLKGYDTSIWFGLVAPAGTPAPVVERLNRELAAVLAMADQKKDLSEDGQTAAPMSPQEFAAFLDQERRKWLSIVKASGAKAE